MPDSHPNIGHIVEYRLPNTPDGQERWRKAQVVDVHQGERESFPPQPFVELDLVVVFDGEADRDLSDNENLLPEAPLVAFQNRAAEGNDEGSWRRRA